MHFWWVTIVLLLPTLVIAYSKQCSYEQYRIIKECSDNVTSKYRPGSSLTTVFKICNQGRRCFEKIHCQGSIEANNVLQAGCEYQYFLQTTFKTCLDIINEKTNCLQAMPPNYTNDLEAPHCAIFKSIYHCVIPAIREHCESEILVDTFKEKYLAHNGMSYDCEPFE
ncbi:unnamed protein product [Caenorhabditis angaria]|uniref:T20D4.11-like domain-containing protein n=1 Tax=Caenorhabditis angaria TaxID=860376 RepID=A0A9P1IZP5_9PELO|nr:unnamed protein product [Caenorhabditis angaria]